MAKTTEDIIAEIQHHLTPDLLLEKRFLGENSRNPLYGHCLAASQALWLLTGMEHQPMFGARDWRGGTHWWLRTENNTILDPTADQYYSIGHAPPYEHGRPVNKWRIHPRTLRLLNKMAGVRA